MSAAAPRRPGRSGPPLLLPALAGLALCVVAAAGPALLWWCALGLVASLAVSGSP